MGAEERNKNKIIVNVDILSIFKQTKHNKNGKTKKNKRFSNNSYVYSTACAMQQYSKCEQ